MRRNILATMIISMFVLLLSACSSSKTADLGKNKDLSADFASIKTYNWSSDVDKIPSDNIFIGPNGVYIFNNESGRKMIKDAIAYELNAKGYTLSSNPDMLVSFAVMEQPASLRTTNGYVTLTTGEKVRTEDNVTYTDVKPGTVLVNFINAAEGRQIWQGFASGILDETMMRDQVKVRQAVSGIFEQFNYNNTGK